MIALREFINRPRRRRNAGLYAASIFSGGGVSDCGYEQAGFKLIAQAEMHPHRVQLCQQNFPSSTVIAGDIALKRQQFIHTLKVGKHKRLDLLAITPPCQGMSSSNPSRGKRSSDQERDDRNRLVMEAIPIISELLPRIFVIENVPQFLSETIKYEDRDLLILELLRELLGQKYEIFAGLIHFADYGIPQSRKRVVIVGICSNEKFVNTLVTRGLQPWPKATHADGRIQGRLPWITVGEWFEFMGYSPLDSISAECARDKKDPLHFVPNYENDPKRYLWIADIPPRSGNNAYTNSTCHACGVQEVPIGLAHCPSCDEIMKNRPHVMLGGGRARLVTGFHSSYRRMPVDKPASTVMTNSSHLGSDYKIHPWENRVLSIRECADLQTVPQYYDWTWAFTTRHTYTAREIIGEALPAWFTFLHGKVLSKLLKGQDVFNALEPIETSR